MIIDHLNIEKEYNIKIIYLTKFGSHLYGTNTENSDTDYLGIFIPNILDCVKNTNPNHIKSNTNPNEKNNKDDVDFSLWSIQKFLKLLGQGDTNAIDLLYSMFSNKIIMEDPNIITYIKNNTLKLFNPKNTKAYVGYAIGQAKKYGIKGSRLGVIKQIHEYINNLNISEFNTLESILYNIDEKFHHDSYCFIKEINNVPSIVLCGKVHLGNIKLIEFKNRINKTYETYGDRSKLAMENKGIDRKAISHALRSIIQMKELLLYGFIKFPLVDSEYLLDIKLGTHNWEFLENEIICGLEEVDELIVSTNITGKIDNNIITNLYKLIYNV